MQPSSLTSRLLVTLQFLCIGYFLVFHPIIQPFGPQDIVAGTFVLAGLTLGAWTFLTLNRISHFRILPEPHTQSVLITTGPYAAIRHPLYTALLCVGAGLFLNYPVLGHFLVFALLFIVLNIKLEREEQFLRKRFPKYAAYQSTTKKLFPFIY